MRKVAIAFMFLISLDIYSQNSDNFCGFDEHMQRINLKYPGLKKERDRVDSRLRTLDKQAFLNKAGGASSWNGLYNGQTFEIPIVVHIIESNAVENQDLIVTDQEVIDWIDRANKMYATTYGNGFYPEGPGPDGGNVIPFKLVLAKRSPQCTATNGILRYNGSSLPLYDTKGRDEYDMGNGASSTEIRNLAPHWPESSYFNIYVVIGFNGNQHLTGGLMGVAPGPDAYDAWNESYMKVAAIKKEHNVTLAHELGHTFGLFHTFTGVGSNNQTSCPVNNDCTMDGDEVCDTSPSRSMFGITPVPDNSSMDPCTGQNYDGTQYNVMNYTADRRKFTTGQRERALTMMLEYRKDLLNSLAGKDPSIVVPSPVSVVAAQCNPSGIVNPNHEGYGVGPNRVRFGSISTMSTGYHAQEPSTNFYEDYSMANCIRPAYATDIPLNSGTEFAVTYNNAFDQSEKYRIKVWIDYNNNGLFESTELAINGVSDYVDWGGWDTFTQTITPPSGAVTNTYLRMRVAVDPATHNGTSVPELATACSPLQYGQMEDYAVRILGTLDASESKIASMSKVMFTKADNKLKLGGKESDAFGDYQIHDMNGRLIQKGHAKTNEIQIERTLPKGIFIINYSDKNKNESRKFINN